jgi:hypothetical protein
MIRCWILIGRRGVRKGSVARALTGVGNGRDCEIALNNGQWLYLARATISSVNESSPPPKPDEWLSSLPNEHHINNFLFLFQINGHAGHDAADYIRALECAESDIRAIVTLGEPTPPWVPPFSAPYAAVPDSAKIPTAMTADAVRTFWGWR